jgi:hypothetical protein
VAVLALTPLAAAAWADGDQPKDPSKPISSSLPGILERMQKEWQAPCEQALALGLPCFPVWVEAEPPKPSTPESLRDSKAATAPVPGGAPTVEEMREYRSGGLVRPMATFYSTDPICTGKSVLKKLKGKNDTYYLYRVTDRSGERMALYDHLLNPASYLSVPDVTFEFLGKFEGECEAVAAYLRAVRRGKPESGANR